MSLWQHKVRGNPGHKKNPPAQPAAFPLIPPQSPFHVATHSCWAMDMIGIRIVLLNITLVLTGPLMAGCAGGTTASEYAGTPRDLLPKDHVEYQPLQSSSAPPPRLASSAIAKSGHPSLEGTFLEEDVRLRKVTKICQNCASIVSATPSSGKSKLAAHEAAVARATED
jgi:hypothetical protein